MTVRDLENFQTSATYKTLTDELKIKAEGRSGKVGKGTEKVTKRINAWGKFMKAIDDFVKKIPIIGFVFKVLGGIFSMYILYICLRNFEFVNDFTENLKLFILEGVSKTGAIDDPRKTLPNCLKYIYGYYDLPMEVRNDVNTIGLTCDNLNQEDPTNFASSIVFVKGGTKMDNTGNKVTTKDKFVVKIGGKEVPFEIGGEITTPSGTYTNDPAGYKKYVDAVKGMNSDNTSKYGASGSYVWEDGAPFYKDSDGKWQAGSYDETKKTFITN